MFKCFAKYALSIQYEDMLLYSYPAGYAKTPVVWDTSRPALLHTVNPIIFFNLICKFIRKRKH